MTINTNWQHWSSHVQLQDHPKQATVFQACQTYTSLIIRLLSSCFWRCPPVTQAIHLDCDLHCNLWLCPRLKKPWTLHLIFRSLKQFQASPKPGFGSACTMLFKTLMRLFRILRWCSGQTVNWLMHDWKRNTTHNRMISLLCYQVKPFYSPVVCHVLTLT